MQLVWFRIFLKISTGGEIFVPKIKSLRVIDLAKTMNYKNKFKIIGMRPGKKLHEQMISSSDSHTTVELKKLLCHFTNWK